MEVKPDTIKKQSAGNDKKAKLSAAWIFVTINYLFCDVIALMDSNLLSQYLTGSVAGLGITERFLLGASILMEIPIAMILLSRILKYRANRMANIIAGIIMTVVQFASLFVGTGPTIYYLFFSVIEITCTSLIIGYAWNWKRKEGPL